MPKADNYSAAKSIETLDTTNLKLIDRILSSAKQEAEQAEVYVSSSNETPVVFEANRVKQLHTIQGTSVALRLIRNGRLGLSVASNLEDIEGLVTRAVEVSQFGDLVKFELPPRISYPHVEVYDPEVEAVTMERMVELGETAIAELRQHTPELVCDARITKRTISSYIVNSRGGGASYKKTVFTMILQGTLVRDTDMLFVGDTDSSCHPIQTTNMITTRIINQLERAGRQASVCTKVMPVIFTPLAVVSALMSPLSMAFNGKIVYQGASPLQDKQGEILYDPRFSLYDDSTIDFRPKSRPCDAEGVPSQRTALVEKGMVRNFLYDLQVAGLANCQSTGNAARDGGLPSPYATALVVEPGDVSQESMVKAMQEGLIVDEVMGAGQTNILGGDISGNVLLGFKVEKGEIVGRVKDTVVSGNVHTMFAEIEGISKEARWVGGSLYCPSLHFPHMAVASKE